MKKRSGILVWIVLWVLFMNGGLLESLFNSGNTQIEYDTNMTTSGYHTAVEVKEDGSYDVSEDIEVHMFADRHGIYRYIPYKGSIVTGNKIPYTAEVELKEANVPVETERKNGSKVFRLGEEDMTVNGDQTYKLKYRYAPKTQEQDFRLAYYNLFPTQWQNNIPAGSTFSVSFPKRTDLSAMKFYTGKYGQTNDAADILDLSIDEEKNTISGTLLQDLEMGEGVTCYIELPKGYYTKYEPLQGISMLILIPSLLIFAVVLLLFVKYGRDEKIIPSIQYQPPEGIDSAAVGYIIDGSVQDKDLLSLIIYWADKGYLKIEEIKENELRLHKVKGLESDAPAYQQTIFNGLFDGGPDVDVKALKYHFSGILEMAGSQIKQHFTDKGQDRIYTNASKRARGVSMLLSTLPFAWFLAVTSLYAYTSMGRLVLQVVMWIALLGGMLYFTHTIDSWYAKSDASRRRGAVGAAGVCFLSVSAYAGSYIVRVMQGEAFNYIWVLAIIIVLTLVMVILTGFMKKRTTECTEWMGRLAGLRDFIETAELERMQVIAKESPQLFYHIIPYAYVFGLSDVFAEKLKELSLPAPDWYETDRSFTFWNYYMFHRCLIGGMNHAVDTLTVPAPATTSGGSGGFGGGSFGGGFSGGGFGGGGGGSW